MDDDGGGRPRPISVSIDCHNWRGDDRSASTFVRQNVSRFLSHSSRYERRSVRQAASAATAAATSENLKLQLSPGLVASYNIQPGNGVDLFWDKHTHLLT